MSKYIFYTAEGYTNPPLEDKEAENCQVLGISEGKSKSEALRKLLSENTWIEDVGFDPTEIICLRLSDDAFV